MKRAVDVSVAQVAGSALAAVIAAMIAGRLGVYGTIIGAGVISVVATTGGPFLQHLLRRTGEGVRGRVGRQGKVPASNSPPPAAASAPPGPGDPYSPPRAHGTRLRGRRRTLLTAVLVFVVAMGGITLYEVLSGQSVSGGSGGTSVGQILGRDSEERNDSPDGRPDRPGSDATGEATDDPTGGPAPRERGGDGPGTGAPEGDDPENREPDADPADPLPSTGPDPGTTPPGDTATTPAPAPVPTSPGEEPAHGTSPDGRDAPGSG